MSDKRLEAAHALFQQGKLEAALDAFQKLRKEDCKVDALHAIAIIQAYQHDYQAALKTIEEAIKLDERNVILLNSKGNILMRLQQFQDAVDTYNKAIKLNNKYAIAYNNLGNCLYKMEKFNAAQKALIKACELQPNYEDASYNLALVYIANQQFDEGAKVLQKLIDNNHYHTKALGQLGELYLEKGEAEKAIPLFEQRLQIQPKHAETHHSLGQAYALTDDLETAIAHYQETLVLEPRHPEVYHNLATATLQSGDSSKALNFYMRQLEYDKSPETCYNIGVLLMYQERNKDALQFLEESVRLDPNNLGGELNIAAIYLKLHQHEKAIQHYQKALELKPNDPEIEYMIAGLRGEETPSQAPDKYLKSLFNQYANYYDEHLTKYLKYDVPATIKQAIFEETGNEKAAWRVLDLGCGTGLSGAAIKPLAKQLIGIDISEEMVEIARKKELYDELSVETVEAALKHYHNLDLIIAADVFTYIGQLDVIFKEATSALTAHGLFCFSVEKGSEGYVLQKTLRYAHSRKYIESLCNQFDFKILRSDSVVLRKQKNEPIKGYLFILTKNNP